MPPRLFAPLTDPSGTSLETTVLPDGLTGQVDPGRDTELMAPLSGKPGGRLAGRTVLVAEDNAIIAMDLQMMLEDRGATVSGPWSTVPEALEAVGEGDIDVALLDLDLKGVDSLPVMEALSAVQVPMVLITGHDVSKRLPGAFASLPVVGKPFTEGGVVSALEAALTLVA